MTREQSYPGDEQQAQEKILADRLAHAELDIAARLQGHAARRALRHKREADRDRIFGMGRLSRSGQTPG